MKRVIIWGYKPHTHTHSYIHWSFFDGFKSLGYETYWFDDNDDVSNFNFENCLFLTSSDQNSKIPLRKDCKYILHNPVPNRFDGLDKLYLQVYTNDVLDREVDKISEGIYYQKNSNTLYQPWATNLLPHEININDIKDNQNSKYCLWVGTYGSDGQFQNGSEIKPFFEECKKNDIELKIIDPWQNPISFEENQNLVKNSFLSPSLQGPWQIEKGYIPCRIFKNISYGHLGITNSKMVNKLFENRLIYDRDPISLFYKCLDKKNHESHISDIRDLMIYVKQNHTYINRIETILNIL